MNASVPGPTLNTTKIAPPTRNGLTADYPVNGYFNHQTFQFITDAGGCINSFFRLWIRSVFEFCNDGDPTQAVRSFPNVVPDMLPNFVNYKDDYSASIYHHESDQGRRRSRYNGAQSGVSDQHQRPYVVLVGLR